MIESILKNIRNYSQDSEVALVCAVDICRAAAYVDPEGDVPLRKLASDIAREIKASHESFSMS